MSTMLKTAAMSLLSKTLQTFLYKYLSDVDVEGVALPSVYDGSGWGVRLSNVKLREGVQLMERMPGSRIAKKRRRRHKPQRKRRKHPTTQPPSSSSTTPLAKESQSPPAAHAESDYHGPQKRKQSPKGSAPPDPQPLQEDRDRQEAEELMQTPKKSLPSSATGVRSPEYEYRRGRSRTTSVDDIEIPVDGEEGGEEEDRSPPETPLQDNKGFFSCFQNSTRRSKTSSGENGDDATVEEESETGDHPDDNGDDDDNRSIRRALHKEEDAFFPDRPLTDEARDLLAIPQMGSSIVVKETKLRSQVSSLQDGEDPSLAGLESRAPTEYDNDKYEEDDDDDDGEIDGEYEEYDQPMQLRLGDNGRIGTLDIRLIDKELHVLVEDALLTIEAIPLVSDPENEDETTENDGGDAGTMTDLPGNQQTDDAVSTMSGVSGTKVTTTPGVAPPTAKPEKAKPEPKRATAGDKVLADNPLAKIISAIPHLLLRDVRVRFIVRQHPTAAGGEDDETTGTATEEAEGDDAQESDSAATSHGSRRNLSSDEADTEDTMVEVGIEFLSVTSGEDILSHFQEQAQDQDSQSAEERGEDEVLSRPPVSTINTTLSSSGESPVGLNDYLIRHIRTGRGPSAGIWVQVYTAGGAATRMPTTLITRQKEDGFSWARQEWIRVTNFHLLRCSGLDLRARIYMGTKKAGSSSWFYDYEEEDEEVGTYDYDDSMLEIDSILMGIDNVVPGPHLPPMNPYMSRGDTPRKALPRSPGSPEENVSVGPGQHGAEAYFQDSNGILSCKVPSNFHRISRGLLPGSCKSCTGSPVESCDSCWEVPFGVAKSSPLDDSMPMPGLALQITFRDPLELNVDRDSVETIHQLKTLFVKKPQPKDINPDAKGKTQVDDNESTAASASDLTSTQDDKTQITASTSMFSGFLLSKKKDVEEEKDPSDAFCTSMQPENIQIIGLHFSKVILRAHVMQEDKLDLGLAFCYWDISADCLTLDQRSLRTKEKMFQDLNLEVGYFNWNEVRGASTKKLASLGLLSPLRERSDSASSDPSRQSAQGDLPSNSVPWPSAASILLDIPPPFETLHYRNRDRHGLQLRFISLRKPTTPKQGARSMINGRLGVTFVDVPWGFWRDVNNARRQITWGMLGKPKTTPVAAKAASGSIMTYSVQIDGGSIAMAPMIRTNMPLTRINGELSPESGFFIEGLLEKIGFSHGKEAPRQKMLSLQQLADLPESIRMRILLCLQDLKPLESALDVKHESNPFKKTRAVNKGILKAAKKQSKGLRGASDHKAHARQHSSGSPSTSRRENLMTEIMKLTDSELDELWSVHQRHKRKLAKKQRSNAGSSVASTK